MSVTGAGAGAAVVRRLDHIWRVFGTGLSFLVFGLGGVLIGWALFPVLELVVRDRGAQRRMARRILQRAFRFFVDLMSVLGVKY